MSVKAGLILCAAAFWLLHFLDDRFYLLMLVIFCLYLFFRFKGGKKWLFMTGFFLLGLGQGIRLDRIDLSHGRIYLQSAAGIFRTASEQSSAEVPPLKSEQPDQQNNTGGFNTKPEAGLYRIVDIRRSYCIAADGKHQILIKNLPQASFGQIYELSEFEEIHSLHNTGIFYFAGFLAGRNIGWQSEGKSAVLRQDSTSLQAQIYNRLKNNPLALQLFYNIKADPSAFSQQADSAEKPSPSSGADVSDGSALFSSQDNWITALGLPVAGWIYLLEIWLTKKTDSFYAFWICTIVLVLYGHLFMWTLSLARMVIFRILGWIRNWPVRWSLEIFLFLILFPRAYHEFTLVLPLMLSLAFRYTKGWHRKALSIWIPAVLQILYFHRLDFVILAGFGLLRKLWGLIFMAGMLLLLLEGLPLSNLAIWSAEMQNWLLNLCFHTLPDLVWHGAASVVMAGMFMVLFVLMLWKSSSRMIAVGFFGICVYMASFYLDPFFHVYQLDIGQGDCCVIVEPFQKSVVMIDAAGTFNGSQARRVIIPFLQSRHLMKVDVLIITHGDQDHDGSRQELEQLWRIEKTIDERTMEIPVSYPFYSLLPERSIARDRNGMEEENDKSIVTWFSYDDFSYLWTGDASSEIEMQLLARYTIAADILKAGHHGSRTSSSRAFLEACDPTLALISAGYRNMYHHPSPQVITRMHSLGIDILQTQENGMIHMATWRHWMMVECADGTVSLIRGKD